MHVVQTAKSVHCFVKTPATLWALVMLFRKWLWTIFQKLVIVFLQRTQKMCILLYYFSLDPCSHHSLFISAKTILQGTNQKKKNYRRKNKTHPHYMRVSTYWPYFICSQILNLNKNLNILYYNQHFNCFSAYTFIFSQIFSKV
jgi:hypothetical protein